MNALVTGGTGFVGSHLIEMLRAHGDNVRATVRRAQDQAYVSRLGAEPVLADLERPKSLAGVCDDCDVVYHAAARVDINGAESEFHRTTVAGTEALVAAAGRAGIKRFVYVSSCGVYHPVILKSGEPIREDTPTGSPPSWWRYGRAKLAAEAIVRERIAPPAEWVILRLGYLFGSRNRAMKQYLYPTLKNRRMIFIGDARNELAMIHVHDAVRAIVAAGRVPAATGRTLIASGTEHVTQRQYFDALADGFGLPRVRQHAPYRVAFAVALIAEYLMPRGFMGGTFQRSAVALTGLPQRIDCSLTQRLLEWTPTVTLADGMREAFDWFHREVHSARQMPIACAAPAIGKGESSSVESA